MAEIVYWAELQSGLSGVGLNVVVSVPKPDYPWFGKIDDKPFTMSIAPKKDDVFHPWMIVSLCGQGEEKVITLLTEFMGYQPFCKYRYKNKQEVSMTYEWEKENPTERFKELSEEDNVCELIKIDEGFQKPAPPEASKFYQEFTSDIVKKWEEAVKENPDAELSCNRLADILPFVKRVMPRIGQNQSLFGLSIISLNGKTKNEEAVVRYGLAPLLKADILTQDEELRIIQWYLQTEPTWDSGGHDGRFEKSFKVDGVQYRLITDSYRNCRDLNLQVLK